MYLTAGHYGIPIEKAKKKKQKKLSINFPFRVNSHENEGP